MGDVVTTTEHTAEEGVREAERDLGAVINEVEHLADDIAKHTTTIDGLKEDRTWITQRFEAIERDLVAIPRLPEELTSTLNESIANLTSRIDALEAGAHHEPETKPPHREERSDESEGHRERPARRSLMDSIW